MDLLHLWGGAKLLEQGNGVFVHRRSLRQIAARLIHKSEVTVSSGHAFLAPERLIELKRLLLQRLGLRQIGVWYTSPSSMRRPCLLCARAPH